MILPTAIFPTTQITWPRAVRIIRSVSPVTDLFEDIADPADWPSLISAEQKTNPRLMETLGMLDHVPPARRVSGPGAVYLMAPFTHVSPDRPSRFSDGTYGVLYVAQHFETALFETMHHHARFMAASAQTPGWTSQFREILMDVDVPLHDLRGLGSGDPVLATDIYQAGQTLAAGLRAASSNGVVYPSVRQPKGGACAGLFYPDLAQRAVQARHLDYHWNGSRVNFYRDVASKQVFEIV